MRSWHFAGILLLALSELACAAKLHRAARKGNFQGVESILADGEDVNRRDGDKKTALHFAANSGHPHVCELLLTKGADVNAQDKDGLTPLVYTMLAARKMEPANAVHQAKLLLRHGADVSTVSREGATALRVATAFLDTRSAVTMSTVLLARGVSAFGTTQRVGLPVEGKLVVSPGEARPEDAVVMLPAGFQVVAVGSCRGSCLARATVMGWETPWLMPPGAYTFSFHARSGHSTYYGSVTYELHGAVTVEAKPGKMAIIGVDWKASRFMVTHVPIPQASPPIPHPVTDRTQRNRGDALSLGL